MDDRIIAIVVLVGILVLAASAAVSISRGSSRKHITREDIEHMAVCVICGRQAEEYAPISGVSWMDKLPLLNRLHSLSPRYTIEDNREGDLCLCKLHKKGAVRMLEQFHAGLRFDRAQFNAEQEGQVIRMDGGSLFQKMTEQHKQHIKVTREILDTPRPMLQQQNSEVIATIMASPSALPEEE